MITQVYPQFFLRVPTHCFSIMLFVLFVSFVVRVLYFVGGTAVAQWLRHCATNLTVAGSIPAGVIGIFH